MNPAKGPRLTTGKALMELPSRAQVHIFVEDPSVIEQINAFCLQRKIARGPLMLKATLRFIEAASADHQAEMEAA